MLENVARIVRMSYRSKTNTWNDVILVKRSMIRGFFFLRHAAHSQFIPLQKVIYFITLPFLLHKILTLYINDVLLFKCPATGPKG